jgi:selenocysteine-specific elongation factor
MYVIGTAGHVDHGKSTLIYSLTGINPDRLKEEKERQMTIDLGFAWYTLPSGEEIGIVDVPGHRDFIENMLAGVGGIDAVLFVVAADEGIMPQSREHLDILKLLGIKLGLIVLTKVDLVEDNEWLNLVEADIRDLVKNSFLEEAPIMKVSAVKKTGLMELSISLDTLLKQCVPKKDNHKPRLPIDRIFSLKGFGTVVTGTLLDGSFKVGDQVEILPFGIKSRIRCIQNHKKKQQIANPGNRTAINLVGVEVNQLQRGGVVCLPDQLRPTHRIDVEINLLESSSVKIKHDDRLKIFIGSSQSMARARVIGQKEIKPGDTGWLQLEFHKEVVVKRKDRFIIRRPSPAATIGGGRVLTAHPVGRHRRFSQKVIGRFKSLSGGSIQDTILVQLSELKISTLSQLIEKSEIEEESVMLSVKQLIQNGQIILFKEKSGLNLTSWLITKKHWLDISKKLIGIIKDYHKKYPLREGIRNEDSYNLIGVSRKAVSLIAEKMQSEGIIRSSEPYLIVHDHQVVFSTNQLDYIKQLEAVFSESPFLTPSVNECIEIVGEEVYCALVSMGKIIEITPSVVFHQKDLDQIIQETRELLGNVQKITAGEFRDHFNTTRKYAVALLEYLDEIGITERIDDFRVLKTS